MRFSRLGIQLCRDAWRLCQSHSTVRIVYRAFPFLTYAHRSFAGGVILRITYGYDVTPRNDEYVRLALAAGGPLLQVVHAGSYLVEYIPALKYIPCEYSSLNCL